MGKRLNKKIQPGAKVSVRRRLVGTVVSDKMTKTVVVEVQRIKLHRLYRKRMRVSARFKAEAETGAYRVGEKVVIEESRPLSKEKRWRVVARA